MIRLALRVRREDAEVALAELLELAPSGVEERELEGGAVIEYAVYGAPGELPGAARPARRRRRGARRGRHRGDPRRLARALEGVPPARRRPRRRRAAGRACGSARRGRRRSRRAAPPVEELVIDPAQAFGTGAHHTTRLCLELLLELEPGGRAASTSAAARASWRSPPRGSAGIRCSASTTRPRASPRRRDNARANGVARRGAARSTCCSTAPRRARRPSWRTSCARCCSPSPRTGFADGVVPDALIASGLLAEEADEVAAAFAETMGLREADRRARRRVGGAAAAPLTGALRSGRRGSCGPRRCAPRGARPPRRAPRARRARGPCAPSPGRSRRRATPRPPPTSWRSVCVSDSSPAFDAA